MPTINRLTTEPGFLFLQPDGTIHALNARCGALIADGDQPPSAVRQQ